MHRPEPSRSTRLLVAALFAAAHLAAQFGLYALAFAVGPESATREILGVSLYGIASVVTFPFVFLAERFGWAWIGLPALLLNSAAWAGALYLVLGLVARLGRRG